MKRSLLALSLLAAIPALGFSTAAFAADGISYNYGEVGYAASQLDNNNVDADGWAARGSVAVHPNFHLFGDYSGQKSDDFSLGGTNVDVDVDQWRAGVGYNHAIAKNVDLVANVAYQKVDVDDVTVNGASFDGGSEDGYSTEVGVRGAMAEKFEGYAMAGYEDFGGDADDFYGRVGAQVKFTPNWGVSGDVKFADGDTQYFVGPRYTW